jgi:hypothetical protein
MKSVLKTLVPFLLIGPPVGFLAMLAGIALFDTLWTCGQSLWCFDYTKYRLPHLRNGGKDLFVLVFLGLPLSYVVGGIPALFVGLVSSVWRIKKNQLPSYVSIFAGFCCALVMSSYYFVSTYRHYSNNEVFSHLPYTGPLNAISEHEWQMVFGASFSWLLSCLIASWVGWKLAVSNAWQFESAKS